MTRILDCKWEKLGANVENVDTGGGGKPE